MRIGMTRDFRNFMSQYKEEAYDANEKLLSFIRMLAENEIAEIDKQLNYADWENPHVTARENYEVARKYGKSIIVMERSREALLQTRRQRCRKLWILIVTQIKEQVYRM